MSDWELMPDYKEPRQQKYQPKSDWELVPKVDETKQRNPKETLGTSAVMAIPRIGNDILKGGVNFIKDIPEYYNQAKKEVPGLYNTLREHPKHALGQVAAGVPELGKNLLDAPFDLANYATNRLNLLPENWNNAIQSKRTPEISQDITQLFGEPKYAGEKLLRGATRNFNNIVGGAGLGMALNPKHLTYKNIAKNIVKTEKNLVNTHTKYYDSIWKQAEKSGYNNVPADMNLLSKDLKTIKKYKTPKEFEALTDFTSNPTLSNAQKAQSQMNRIARTLKEKSSKGALEPWENKLYDSAIRAEKHIEDNMFKNTKGETNNALKKEYKKVTKSYRENVVPYKYNSDIQSYKNKEMLPKELFNALSKGEFAAKKGGAHPAMGIRNLINPTWSKIGTGGVLALLAQQMLGGEPKSE